MKKLVAWWNFISVQDEKDIHTALLGKKAFVDLWSLQIPLVDFFCTSRAAIHAGSAQVSL